MALSLFPARAAIGKVQLPDGKTAEVIMTPEFSRALTSLYEVIGGDSGESAADIALAAAQARLEAAAAFDVILPVATSDPMAMPIDSETDNSAMVADLRNQLENMEVEMASQMVVVSMLRDELLQMRAEMSADRDMGGLLKQIENLQISQAMQEDTGALARYMQQAGALEDFDSTNSKIVPGAASGSRGGNVALASLLTALANSGLVINNTVP